MSTQQPQSNDCDMRLRPPPTGSRRSVGACASITLGGPQCFIQESTSAANADRLKAGGFKLAMDNKIYEVF
jgi:hypothetical protein